MTRVFKFINFSLIIFTISLSLLQNKTTIKPYFYTLVEEYNLSYEPNYLYSVSYYLRSDIVNDDLNERLYFKDLEVNIEHKERLKGSKYNNSYYDLMKLYFYLAKPLICDGALIKLKYLNTTYSLLAGDFRVKAINYKSLDLNYLNIHYAYINNNLLPVGISLAFNRDILIKKAYLSRNLALNLAGSIKNIPGDVILNNLDEESIYSFKDSSLFLKRNERCYIPLSYKRLVLLNNLSLVVEANLERYLINLRGGLISYKNIYDYPGFLKEAL